MSDAGWYVALLLYFLGALSHGALMSAGHRLGRIRLGSSRNVMWQMAIWPVIAAAALVFFIKDGCR